MKIKELKLVEEINKKHYIKVKVRNKSRCADAVNVNIEMCVVEAGYTYHFKIDKNDFLIIPHKGNKAKEDNYLNFKAIDLLESTKEIIGWENEYFSSFVDEKVKNQKATVCVRVYATHEYSGSGKAFERKFKYNKGKNEFFRYKHF